MRRSPLMVCPSMPPPAASAPTSCCWALFCGAAVGATAGLADVAAAAVAAQANAAPVVVPGRNQALYELFLRGLRLLSEWTSRVLEQVGAGAGARAYAA